ncbi:MAG: LUD domain-containing protein [Candidatus Thorarchaeota archaeon]
MEKASKKVWKHYYKDFTSSLKSEPFRRGTARATSNYEKGIKETFDKFPESPELAKEVRAIKEYSISHHRELLDVAKQKFEDIGAKVLIVKNRQEALDTFKEIIGSGKVIVKGKSMTTEEIRLREFLIDQNNEVWETDLGEFIIQLNKERPMHIVNPSLHVPREEIAKLFSKHLGSKLDPNDVNGMVLAARKFLREKYYSADFGIIGANVVSAQDAKVVTIHNEGNITLSSVLPENLIIFTGIEKIVPTLEDALKTAFVTSRYVKYKIAGYYNVFGSSSDFRSRNVYLILIDNGRSDIISNPVFREAAYCVRCGACMYPCPVFKVVAGKFGGPTYVGGIGAIWTWFIDGKEPAIPPLFSCMDDGSCRIACPVDIDIPGLIHKLKREVIRDSA